MAKIKQTALEKYSNEDLREIYRNSALNNWELLPKEIASIIKQNSNVSNRVAHLCQQEIVRRFVNQIIN